MALIVDIRHWLDANGELPTDNLGIRRRALRIAQLIEGGGPLKVGQVRETLVPCTLRPKGKACIGLLWVEKRPDERIWAYCLACQREEILISGWQETLWAAGPQEPVSDEDYALLPEAPPPPNVN